MRNSSKSKNRYGNKPGLAKHATVSGAPRRLSRWTVLGLCLLAAGATWALFEFVVWNKLPPELVGKWVVVEGPQEGATFDFFRNGRMTGKVNVGGNEGIVSAAIRVEGKSIFSTTLHPQTGREDTRVQTIRTLTSQALVLEDEQGKLLTMERAE